MLRNKGLSVDWDLIPQKFEPIPDAYQLYFLYGIGRKAFVRLSDFNESQTYCDSPDLSESQ